MLAIPFLDLSYGTDMSQSYDGFRVDFGENYSQRSKSLNGAPQKWRLVWENIPDETAEELRLFFEEAQGVDLIVWTPYNQVVPLAWTADGWQSKPTGFQRQNASITLSQEFDLFVVPPVNTVAPSILGVPKVLNTLTADVGLWTGDQSGGSLVEWYRNNVKVATGANYVLSNADLGAYLRIRVSVLNAEGTPGQAYSPIVGPVGVASALSNFALALPFDRRSNGYWRNAVSYAAISSMPGYSFSRAGSIGVVDSDGSIDTFAANVPAIHDEGYRPFSATTNVLLQSQDLANAAWTKASVAIAPNAIVAPDGTLTADKLNGTGAVPASSYVEQYPAKAAASQTRTVSVFAKAGEWPFLLVAAGNAAFGNYVMVAFNLATGTFGAPSVAGAGFAHLRSSMKALGNGWYRCTIVVTTDASTTCRTLFYASDQAAGGSATGGNGTSGIYLWQAQNLLGYFADGGPIIPTSAAAAATGEDFLAVTDVVGADADQLFIIRTAGRVAGARLGNWNNGEANRVEIATGNNFIECYVIAAGNVAAYSFVGYTLGDQVTAFWRRLGGQWRLGYVKDGVLYWGTAAAAGAFPTGMNVAVPGNYVYASGSPPNEPVKGMYRRLGSFATDASILAVVAELEAV
jgi:phage-related protein